MRPVELLVMTLSMRARELGEIEANEDPRDQMPDGGAYDRVVAAEKAIVAHIDALEAKLAAHKRGLPMGAR